MTAAGHNGTPQIVSIGCYDLVDFVGWQDTPSKLAGQETHAHNRLLSSVMMTSAQRVEMAQEMCAKLSTAKGPTTVVLPLQGGNEWDRSGGPLCDPDGLDAFLGAMREHCPKNAELLELDSHINDAAFAETVLEVFDKWLSDGTIKRG